MAELLVVGSKVREVIKKGDMNMSGEFLDALSKKVEGEVKRAIERAKANGRKTVRENDL